MSKRGYYRLQTKATLRKSDYDVWVLFDNTHITTLGDIIKDNRDEGTEDVLEREADDVRKLKIGQSTRLHMIDVTRVKKPKITKRNSGMRKRKTMTLAEARRRYQELGLDKEPSRKQAKAQANAKKAMNLYRSGKADSLKEAWAMVKGKKNPRKSSSKRRKIDNQWHEFVIMFLDNHIPAPYNMNSLDEIPDHVFKNSYQKKMKKSFEDDWNRGSYSPKKYAHLKRKNPRKRRNSAKFKWSKLTAKQKKEVVDRFSKEAYLTYSTYSPDARYSRDGDPKFNIRLGDIKKLAPKFYQSTKYSFGDHDDLIEYPENDWHVEQFYDFLLNQGYVDIPFKEQEEPSKQKQMPLKLQRILRGARQAKKFKRRNSRPTRTQISSTLRAARRGAREQYPTETKKHTFQGYDYWVTYDPFEEYYYSSMNQRWKMPNTNRPIGVLRYKNKKTLLKKAREIIAYNQRKRNSKKKKL